MAEFRDARTAQVGADAIMQVPSPRTQTAVSFTKVFASLIQSAKFSGQSVNVLGVQDLEATCLADGLFAECLHFRGREEGGSGCGRVAGGQVLEGFLLFDERGGGGRGAFGHRAFDGGAVCALLGAAAVHNRGATFGFVASVAMGGAERKLALRGVRNAAGVS